MSVTVQVEYIGAKPSKTDNIGGTGIVWMGEGDVQPVPIEAWAKMMKHTGVWRAVETADPAPRSLASATPAPAPTPAPTPAPAPAEPTLAMLYGTDHPALIDIDGEQVQLGTLVAATQTGSGLSVADWNGLTDADRKDFVDAEIEASRTAAADAKVKAAAAVAKAEAKAAAPVKAPGKRGPKRKAQE